MAALARIIDPSNTIAAMLADQNRALRMHIAERTFLMPTPDIESRVREVLSDTLGVTESLLDDDTNLVTDLDADSLNIIEIAMALEEEFDCELPDETTEDMKTVGDVLRVIKQIAGA